MSIREATLDDAPGIARVSVDTWRVAYRGIVPDEVLNGLTYRAREEQVRRYLTDPNHPDRGSILYVAEERGEIVGFAMGGPERTGDAEYLGEVYAIYVLPAHQGKGIGKRLVRAVAAALTERGLHSMVIYVLSDNHPSCRFYEALGGKPVRTKPITLGVELQETGYGWRDTSSLRAEG